jgi:ParB family chromosome partitioning protein
MTAKNKNTPFTSLRAAAESDLEGITKQTTFRIDPNIIEFEEGFNLRQPGREFDEHVEQLYRAMKAGAFVPPVDVAVSEGKVIARDGHCRTLAARKLRKEEKDYTLECRQLRGNEVDAVLHMLGTGTGGKPLSPLEAGLGYLRLTKMGQTTAQIANKLGISRVTVDNGLTLAEAPVSVQKLILDGAVSATTAREAIKNGKQGIAALKAAAEQQDATPEKTKSGKKKKVTAKKLKGTAAEKKAKKKKKTAEQEPPAEPDPANIAVTIPRNIAEEAVRRIRESAVANEHLKALAVILETALL